MTYFLNIVANVLKSCFIIYKEKEKEKKEVKIIFFIYYINKTIFLRKGIN